MIRHLAVSLAAATCAAQDQASTLAVLADRASVIAPVRVVALDTSDPATTHAVLRPGEPLRGELATRIVLHEPGGHGCGRALAGLVPGAAYLAFFDHAGGRLRLVTPNARSVPPLTPGLRDHVRDLVASTGITRVAVLAGALASAEPRIATDAAAALATHRELAAAGPAARGQIARTARAWLAAPRAGTVELLHCGARLGLDEVHADAVAAWVTASRPPLAAALADTVRRFDPERTAQHVAALGELAPAARRRAAAVLDPDTPTGRRLLRAFQPAPASHEADAEPRRFRSVDPLSLRPGPSRRAVETHPNGGDRTGPEARPSASGRKRAGSAPAIPLRRDGAPRRNR